MIVITLPLWLFIGFVLLFGYLSYRIGKEDLENVDLTIKELKK